MGLRNGDDDEGYGKESKIEKLIMIIANQKLLNFTPH